MSNDFWTGIAFVALLAFLAPLIAYAVRDWLDRRKDGR